MDHAKMLWPLIMKNLQIHLQLVDHDIFPVKLIVFFFVIINRTA